MRSLNLVWRAGLNGDELCQNLWNDLDYDVKVIAQKKIERMM